MRMTQRVGKFLDWYESDDSGTKGSIVAQSC
jgi:hypothetical protein